MSTLSGIYDSNPIQPVVKIKENISIYTGGKYSNYSVEFIEPMPRSSPMVVEMVAATGNTSIAANGQIAKAVVNILQLAENEFLQLRWYPLDNVEGVLWEQSAVGRFVTRSVQSRVNILTPARDPYLSTTTFFVLGMNRDINLEVQNPQPIIVPVARFVFFGFRYVLQPLDNKPAITTYIPAEGYSTRAS